ncbi:hypothetical protein JTB14_013902 [Gonioctena quinquepunctata]|nr:hypothetical protein JTB14_013902 [Gonioctena quinquepunctata]
MDKGSSGFRASGIFSFNPNKFTAAAEKFREHILHIDSDEGKMNIVLPAPQIPIPEAIAEPAPSISATVLETSLSCSSFAKVSDVAPIPKKTVEKSTNRKTAKKQQSEIWTSTPMTAKRDEKNYKQKITNKRKLNTRGKEKQTKVNIKKRAEKEEKTSEEDSESSVELSLSDDSNSDTSKFTIAQRPHSTGEICIICGEFGENRAFW